MPIYAYKCSACGFAKDALQKMSDPPLTECPACGASAFTKQVTAAGFQLKGSGWYVTDFRDGGGKKPGDKPAEAGADKDKGAESGSDDKKKPDAGADKGAPASGAAAKPGDSASAPAASPSSSPSPPPPPPPATPAKNT